MKLFNKLKSKLSLELIIALGLLVFSIWFNLDLYRAEPTAKIDPNDNTFQFALVHRTNQIWDFAATECPKNVTFPFCFTGYLIDHWTHNWAQGYNLPFYYSHVPQIVIVGSYRFISWFQTTIQQFNNLPAGRQGVTISLFEHYHLFIYLLLCFFPISVFLALRVIRLPWLIAGVGAVLATHISTDGLYGLDPSSFLWRGYGLSSQLFAMIWAPLALAYSFRYLTETRDKKHETSEIKKYTKFIFLNQIIQYSIFSIRNSSFLLAVAFIVFTVWGHLGIGVMVLLSTAVISIAPIVLMFFNMTHLRDMLAALKSQIIKLGLLGSASIFFLSYWVGPVMLYNNYHNISVWDPIWKFNSFGWEEVMTRFFNGDLFDFGRFPVFTLLIIVGAFAAALTSIKYSFNRVQDRQVLSIKKDQNNNKSLNTKYQIPDANKSYFAFSLLFLFWTVMYFGRTTWGGLIDLIPGMTEFHISRFIVGMHLIGFFLAPIGVMAVSNAISNLIYKFFTTRKSIANPPQALTITVTLILLIAIARPIYNWTIEYNDLNNRLIVQGNENFDRVSADVDQLFRTIDTLPPARVFVGRGGGWGKDFTVAETQMFMHISTYGVPTALWLPETWSPNSDTEQYFSEDVARDYDTYNLRWIAAPPDVEPQPFWTKLPQSTPFWNLYEASTSGYFAPGARSQIVVTDKTSYLNIVRLWIQSDLPEKRLHPQLTFDKPKDNKIAGLPIIYMQNEVDYKTRFGDRKNIFSNNPLITDLEAPKVSLIGPEEVIDNMIFATRIQVDEGCKECLVVLKQTYHPNWRVWVDGKKVKPINVFPFHIGIPVSSAGEHVIRAEYKPYPMKLPLFLLGLVTALGLLIYPKVIKKQ